MNSGEAGYPLILLSFSRFFSNTISFGMIFEGCVEAKASEAWREYHLCGKARRLARNGDD